jgi:hypothetical protein
MAGYKRKALSSQERRHRPITLGALADRAVDVFCWCNRCGHNATVAIGPLLRQLGPAMPVPEVGTRMRCTGCGSKDVATRPAWPSMGQITRHGRG